MNDILNVLYCFHLHLTNTVIFHSLITSWFWSYNSLLSQGPEDLQELEQLSQLGKRHIVVGGSSAILLGGKGQ